jgi:hypothetical protein
MGAQKATAQPPDYKQCHFCNRDRFHDDRLSFDNVTGSGIKLVQKKSRKI